MAKIWTRDDEIMLINEYPFGNAKDLSIKFGVSIKSINKKARRLKLIKWKEPFDDNLKTCLTCKIRKCRSLFNKDKLKNDGIESHCRECKSKRNIIYYNKNKEKIKIKHKNYNELNKDKNRITKRKYLINVLKKDINYRILHSLRSRLSECLKLRKTFKNNKTLDLLGCSKEFLRNYLESKFLDGMSWENYGKEMNNWNIDHIIPCDAFDLTKIEQQKICFHYTNLQPLWKLDNILKSNKIIQPRCNVPRQNS